MSENENFIEVDLGEQGILRFADEEEIGEFLNRERAYWNWLHEPPVQNRLNNNASRHINGNINQIRNYLDHLKTGPSQPRTELLASFKRTFDQGRIPVSTSPVASFIDELKRENPITAAAALTAWMNLEGIRLHVFEEVKGVILMSAFDANISNKTPTATRNSLKKLNQSFTETLANAQTLLNGQKSEFEHETRSQRSTMAKLLWRIRRNARQFRAKQAEETRDAIHAINQTDELYKQHMALEGPVQYWNDKSTSHQNTAKTYRCVLAVFGVVASVVLVGGLYWLAEHAIQIASADKPPTIYLVLVTLGVVATTILFWIARILTRLFLSEHHLAIDARERAVMAQTYLALTAEGQASEQERALVLAALFRPTADGIVKDDAAPDLSPAVLLSKFDPK